MHRHTQPQSSRGRGRSSSSLGFSAEAEDLAGSFPSSRGNTTWQVHATRQKRQLSMKKAMAALLSAALCFYLDTLQGLRHFKAPTPLPTTSVPMGPFGFQRHSHSQRSLTSRLPPKLSLATTDHGTFAPQEARVA